MWVDSQRVVTVPTPLAGFERGVFYAWSGRHYDQHEVVVLASKPEAQAEHVQLVTHGCAEPAWRTRRVWIWGDVEPVYQLLLFVTALVREARGKWIEQ